MMRAPKVIRSEVHAVCEHDDENDRKNERNRKRHHNTGTKAEGEKADDKNNRQRFSERDVRNSPTDSSTTRGWSAICSI